jgi:hypothetical protein
VTAQFFLRDQWYAAATAAEVTSRPLGRKICNEDIVMFRGRDGTVARYRLARWSMARSSVHTTGFASTAPEHVR